MAHDMIFSTERLRTLFEPRSIALVGASEKSVWSLMVHLGLTEGGFDGKICYVHPHALTVHGRPAVARLADLTEPTDLCYIMVGKDSVLSVLQDMIAVGIHNAVVLTDGFAEQSEHGKALQAEITDLAIKHDLAIIGPNCIGYINVTRRIEAIAAFPERPLLTGPIALISQSGALGGMTLNYARTQNIGLSMLVSTGNEAVISITDALQYAIEDEATAVIALFMETVREPEHFRQMAQQALERGKPIVALKVGRSEVVKHVALTHTGALTGNDRVIDALFRQLGIVRVNTTEELILTANVFAKTQRLTGKRVGVVALSGGVCDLVADLVEETKIELPALTEQTKNAVQALLPTLSTVYNPLDVTGATMNNQALIGNVLSVVAQDSQLDAVLCVMDLPKNETSLARFQENILVGIGQALERAPFPAFLLQLAGNDVTEIGRAFLKRTGIPFISGGIRNVLPALGNVITWQERRHISIEGRKNQIETARVLPCPDSAVGCWSEYQARIFLETHGLPIIPATLTTNPQQAVAAARVLGFPVVLKIVSPDILHKSDIGGVRLDLRDDEAVYAAFEQITGSAQALTPRPHIDGVLVSPLRSGGIELLVGITRDVSWGQVLAVGLGGIWIEALNDISLRVLPVTRADIQNMLAELQGIRLLHGTRGFRPVDMEALVDVIYRVAALAQHLSFSLESLEINPLRIDDSQIEILDAVITWQHKA